MLLLYLIVVLFCNATRVDEIDNEVEINPPVAVYDIAAFREFLAEFGEVPANFEGSLEELSAQSKQDFEDYFDIFMNYYFLPRDEEVYQNRFSLIFPGTKWCGPGNLSSSDSDVGVFYRADYCCQQHDMCADYIEGGQSKHGLTNTGAIIKLHCDCDSQFYICLKTVNTRVSNKIGRIFFNIAASDCFREDYPITGCDIYTFLWTRCLKYRLDMTQPKKYQWFNNPKY